jgi:hypothetical protein
LHYVLSHRPVDYKVPLAFRRPQKGSDAAQGRGGARDPCSAATYQDASRKISARASEWVCTTAANRCIGFLTNHAA